MYPAVSTPLFLHPLLLLLFSLPEAGGKRFLFWCLTRNSRADFVVTDSCVNFLFVATL